jgi:hypothetical protein
MGRSRGDDWAKSNLPQSSWPGRSPAIHEFLLKIKNVDGRHKAGHPEDSYLNSNRAYRVGIGFSPR